MDDDDIADNSNESINTDSSFMYSNSYPQAYKNKSAQSLVDGTDDYDDNCHNYRSQTFNIFLVEKRSSYSCFDKLELSKLFHCIYIVCVCVCVKKCFNLHCKHYTRSNAYTYSLLFGSLENILCESHYEFSSRAPQSQSRRKIYLKASHTNSWW